MLINRCSRSLLIHTTQQYFDVSLEPVPRLTWARAQEKICESLHLLAFRAKAREQVSHFSLRLLARFLGAKSARKRGSLAKLVELVRTATCA